MPFELFTLIILLLRINSSNIHNPCFPANYVGGIIRYDFALGRVHLSTSFISHDPCSILLLK